MDQDQELHYCYTIKCHLLQLLSITHLLYSGASLGSKTKANILDYLFGGADEGKKGINNDININIGGGNPLLYPMANVDAPSLFPALPVVSHDDIPSVAQHPLVNGGLLLHPGNSDDLIIRNFLEDGAPKSLVDLLKRIAKDGKLPKEQKEALFNFASDLSSKTQVGQISSNHYKTPG